MINRHVIGILPVVLLLAGCPYSDWDPDWNYSVSIERYCWTEEEEALIAIAENVCPLREDVLAAADAGDRAALEAEAGDGCLWWYTMEKLPYAITAGAIEYWAAEVERFRERAESRFGPYYPEARFTYFATIEFQDRFEEGEKQFDDVYLVTMIMSYTEGTSPVSGLGFGKQRTVVLTAEGEVLAVFGDGATSEEVA